jgi:hypothetical protein
MANLTNKASYAGATSITFTAPTSVTMKYQSSDDFSEEIKWGYGDGFGVQFEMGISFGPIGFGGKTENSPMVFNTTATPSGSTANSSGNSWQLTAFNKLDESNKYTVKPDGALAPYTCDQGPSCLEPRPLRFSSGSTWRPSSSENPQSSCPAELNHSAS